jgi:glycosyltransferase involved in cell wall biosynthesis
MYINKPIIASNCAPIERIVNETNSGIIFNSGDADDLAKKIVQLATKSVIIPNARHWVKEKYCWDNDSKVLVKIYS